MPAFDEDYSSGRLYIKKRPVARRHRRARSILELKRELGELGERANADDDSRRKLCRRLLQVAAPRELGDLMKTMHRPTLAHRCVDIKGYPVGMIWFCLQGDDECRDAYHQKEEDMRLLWASTERLVLLDLKAFLDDEAQKQRLHAWLASAEGITLDALEICMDHELFDGDTPGSDSHRWTVREYAQMAFDTLYKNRTDLPDEALVPLASETFTVASRLRRGAWILHAEAGNVLEIRTGEGDEEAFLQFRVVAKDEWRCLPYRTHVNEGSLHVAADSSRITVRIAKPPYTGGTRTTWPLRNGSTWRAATV